MKQSMKLFAAIFLMLLLAMSTEMGPRGVEARYCKTPSHTFRGICVRNRNCASVCESERFSGGECDGFRRRCLCLKPC